ncbi:MAG: stage V sporulation protein AA [Lachnospiraceae bacterium]|nr:stage V sporulation protein AA [Lachnospiraceae bacterium]
MSTTVYLKADKNTEVHEKDVFLSQVAQVWCRDKVLENKCKAIKVMTIHADREDRFVMTVLDLVEMIQKLDSHAEVENLGVQEMIIDYQPQAKRIRAIDWLKTAFVCLIVFFGGAFAIMTFNNDGSVSEIFKDVDRLLVGESMAKQSEQQAAAKNGLGSNSEQGNEQKTTGILILEVSYSIGLVVGVTLFFNHFGKHKVTTDPTPIEVQMRLYEDQVDTTVIQNASRKESGVDTQ